MPSNGTSPSSVSMNLNSVATSQSTPSIISSDPGSPSMVLSENGLLVEQTTDSEWFDPNEPRYCVCNQVSYGDMVACDNDSVSRLSFWQTCQAYHRHLDCMPGAMKFGPSAIVSMLIVFFFFFSPFINSVHTNGSIIHALVLRNRQKGNGTVRNVHQRSKNEAYANECLTKRSHSLHSIAYVHRILHIA